MTVKMPEQPTSSLHGQARAWRESRTSHAGASAPAPRPPRRSLIDMRRESLNRAPYLANGASPDAASPPSAAAAAYRRSTRPRSTSGEGAAQDWQSRIDSARSTLERVQDERARSAASEAHRAQARSEIEYAQRVYLDSSMRSAATDALKVELRPYVVRMLREELRDGVKRSLKEELKLEVTKEIRAEEWNAVVRHLRAECTPDVERAIRRDLEPGIRRRIEQQVEAEARARIEHDAALRLQKQIRTRVDSAVTAALQAKLLPQDLAQSMPAPHGRQLGGSQRSSREASAPAPRDGRLEAGGVNGSNGRPSQDASRPSSSGRSSVAGKRLPESPVPPHISPELSAGAEDEGKSSDNNKLSTVQEREERVGEVVAIYEQELHEEEVEEEAEESELEVESEYPLNPLLSAEPPSIYNLSDVGFQFHPNILPPTKKRPLPRAEDEVTEHSGRSSHESVAKRQRTDEANSPRDAAAATAIIGLEAHPKDHHDGDNDVEITEDGAEEPHPEATSLDPLEKYESLAPFGTYAKYRDLTTGNGEEEEEEAEEDDEEEAADSRDQDAGEDEEVELRDGAADEFEDGAENDPLPRSHDMSEAVDEEDGEGNDDEEDEEVDDDDEGEEEDEEGEEEVEEGDGEESPGNRGGMLETPELNRSRGASVHDAIMIDDD